MLKPHPSLSSSIALNQVSFSYGKNPILSAIDFELKEGEFVALLGPSGCGKSTLLKLIAKISQPTQGKITYPASFSQESLGVVYQEPRLLPWRTALQNVVLPLEFKSCSKEENKERAKKALSDVGLFSFYDAYPSELSGGMKMRVSIARALVTNPPLLLLDEPFSALDEASRQTLQEDLRILWKKSKLTALFVTHSASEAVFLANRAIVLSTAPARITLDTQIHLSERMDDKPALKELRHNPHYLSEIQRMTSFLLNARGSL